MVKTWTRIKAILLFLFILIPVLISGCSGEKIITVDEYVPEQDSEFFYLPGIGIEDSGFHFAESQDGYYYSANSFVYFIDKETLKAIPLCNKPNCKHDSDECNSAFHTYHDFIAFYKGNLYVKGEAPDKEERALMDYIYKVSPDGSKREVVLKYKDVSQFGEPMTIHRGYIYIVNPHSFSWEDVRVGASVSRYSLDNPNEREILFSSDLKNANVRLESIYGNYLYIYESGFVGEELISRNHIYNLVTGEIKEVKDPKSGGSSPNFATIFNGKAFYLYSLDLPDIEEYEAIEDFDERDAYLRAKNLNTVPLKAADLWGEDPVEQMEIEVVDRNSDIIADSKYLYEYCHNYFRISWGRWAAAEGSVASTKDDYRGRYLKVWDEDLNEIAKVDIGGMDLPGDYVTIYLTHGDHIFLAAQDKSNYVQSETHMTGEGMGYDEVLYAIDKRDFYKEKIEVKEVIRREVMDMGWNVIFDELP